jgi:16S rRNA processing protein RimM
MSAASDDYICLGVVIGAAGIKGEVKLKSFTQEPLGIGDYGPLFDETGTKTFKIKSLRATNKAIIAKFAGINDRNEAEALIRQELYVPRSALPEAEDDVWYYSDLVGLEARSPEGDVIGTVEAVHNFGAGDLLEIKLAGGQHTEMLSFTSKTVPKVDIAAKYIIVIWPEDVEARDDKAEDDGP